MKIPSSNLGRTWCIEIVSDFQNNFCTNMVSPCSAKTKASDKDLPVQERNSLNSLFCTTVKLLSLSVKKHECPQI